MTKLVPLAIAACTFAAAAVAFVPSRAQNSSTATVGKSSDPAALPDQELGRRFVVLEACLLPLVNLVRVDLLVRLFALERTEAKAVQRSESSQHRMQASHPHSNFPSLSLCGPTLKYCLTSSCTLGIRVDPPTSTTSLIWFLAIFASVSTFSTGARHALK